MKLFSNSENKRYVKLKHYNKFRESAGVSEVVYTLPPLCEFT